MENEQKIPKIIHYCWFGGNPLPPLALKCIESWKKYCPDYEIMEWNETNFPPEYNTYVKEAYEARKWAFVSDVARLHALVEYGGVYMDTDVELLRPIDGILTYDAISGFEISGSVPTGLMAAKRGHPFFRELLADYDGDRFITEDGTPNLRTNVDRITMMCLPHGLVLNDTEQTILGFTFMPHDYFCPKDTVTGNIHLTENTYAIHHFDGSWLPDEKKYAIEYRKRHPKIPRAIAPLWSGFVAAVKFRGFFGAIGATFAFFRDGRRKKKEMKRAAKEAKRDSQ